MKENENKLNYSSMSYHISELDNDVCKLVFPYHYGKTYKNYIKLFILHKNFILVKQNKKLKKSFV